MKILALVAFLLASQLAVGASRDIRAEKKFQFTMQHGYDYKTMTTSGMFSYFIDADNQIGIRAGTGHEDDDHQAHVSIQSKHFLANSFYIAPELYYLNYYETDHDDDFDFFDSNDEKIQAMGLSVRIGNQWQFKNFTIGCDWFGMGKNLAHWKRTDDSFSHRYTFTILNFYLGWSF